MEYFEEFEDGLLKGRGFQEDAQKVGVWSYYYDNGQLKQEVEYRTGIKDGLFRLYHENGQLAIEANNKNGEIAGIWREYYENGELKTIGEYVDDKYYPRDFWDEHGRQTLVNGTGYTIEEFGYNDSEVFFQYFEEGKFVKEVKMSSIEYGRFTALND